ncbi:MAG: nickel-dependent lactate racemase [Clostridia bacterium]|nr:nickel-dependent lactate racemase [Clostridia bacterium]
MKTVRFPYGTSYLEHTFAENELQAVLLSKIEEYDPHKTAEALVKDALEHPIGSAPLWELAKGKRKVVLIASDHTRPVPSRVIVPQMLTEIRRGNPEAEITILIATGCHRETTAEELMDKFGPEIATKERIVIHDCDDRAHLLNVGTLPSGSPCEINSIAAEADLLVSEGFIEPHFFAGYSGGRKSVMPGVAARSTVMGNHCSEFIDDPHARTGILDGNPIHRDMLWVAKTAKLRFIVNVVLNGEKQVIHAVAGDVDEAHRAGVSFLSSLCATKAVEADVVLTTNGGYPLDQNMYQAVKGMTAAEATVKAGGVIIMLARSGDGIGGDHFYHQLADEPDIHKTMALFRSRARGETVPDQWQTQILLRILMHAHVIYVSEMDDETVRRMHMTPAHSIGEALAEAKRILKNPTPTVTAIPDGISVIVTK